MLQQSEPRMACRASWIPDTYRGARSESEYQTSVCLSTIQREEEASMMCISIYHLPVVICKLLCPRRTWLDGFSAGSVSSGAPGNHRRYIRLSSVLQCAQMCFGNRHQFLEEETYRASECPQKKNVKGIEYSEIVSSR